MTAETIPTAADYLIARRIARSDFVLGVFAAPEWEELSEDGHAWVAAIVAEARRECLAEVEKAMRLTGTRGSTAP